MLFRERIVEVLRKYGVSLEDAPLSALATAMARMRLSPTSERSMAVSVSTVKLADLPRELRRLRREVEISQQTVGDRMGWHSRNLVRWENGKSPKLCVAQ